MRAYVGAALSALLLVAVGMGALSGVALADGDPGSDVLVYQDLFVAGDAGMSVTQQAQLGDLLKSADRAGFPIRVAIISSPADLGAITDLWLKPRAYARFLGYELSLAYKQRLLVVMPNGFGFNWPGHSTGDAARTLAGLRIGAGGAGLYTAGSSAGHALAAAAGVRLAGASGDSTPAGSAGTGSASPPSLSAPESVVGGGNSAASSNSGHSADTVAAVIVVALLVAAGLVFAGRYALARRRRAAAAPEALAAAAAAPD